VWINARTYNQPDSEIYNNALVVAVRLYTEIGRVAPKPGSESMRRTTAGESADAGSIVLTLPSPLADGDETLPVKFPNYRRGRFPTRLPVSLPATEVAAEVTTDDEVSAAEARRRGKRPMPVPRAFAESDSAIDSDKSSAARSRARRGKRRAEAAPEESPGVVHRRSRRRRGAADYVESDDA